MYVGMLVPWRCIKQPAIRVHCDVLHKHKPLGKVSFHMPDKAEIVCDSRGRATLFRYVAALVIAFQADCIDMYMHTYLGTEYLEYICPIFASPKI